METENDVIPHGIILTAATVDGSKENYPLTYTLQCKKHCLYSLLVCTFIYFNCGTIQADNNSSLCIRYRDLHFKPFEYSRFFGISSNLIYRLTSTKFTIKTITSVTIWSLLSHGLLQK